MTYGKAELLAHPGKWSIWASAEFLSPLRPGREASPIGYLVALVATAAYSIYIYHITLDDADRVRKELGLPELGCSVRNVVLDRRG